MSKYNRDYWLKMAAQYYAAWVEVHPSEFGKAGVTVQASTERTHSQAGYSKPFTVLGFVKGNRVIVSSHPEHIQTVRYAINDLDSSDYVGSLAALLGERLDTKVTTTNKYWFTGLPARCTSSGTRPLGQNDYSSYKAFFEHQHGSGTADREWLQDYFAHIVQLEYCYGAFVDGKLASVTDAPDIPYLSEKIVEPGINTLPEFRGRGLAKRVCTAMIETILRHGRVPVWSCSSSNAASAALAESLGYQLFGTRVTVSMS